MEEKTKSKVSLYSLTAEYNTLYHDLIESVDDDGQMDLAIKNALDLKEKEFEEKAICVATVYRQFEGQIELYEKEIERLKDCKKKLEKCRDRIKERLSVACETTGIDKIESMYANISFRKSKQVVIDDKNMLPVGYLKEVISYEPDKMKIKKDLENGKEVQGAYLKVNRNLQIQ